MCLWGKFFFEQTNVGIYFAATHPARPTPPSSTSAPLKYTSGKLKSANHSGEPVWGDWSRKKVKVKN